MVAVGIEVSFFAAGMLAVVTRRGSETLRRRRTRSKVASDGVLGVVARVSPEDTRHGRVSLR